MLRSARSDLLAAIGILNSIKRNALNLEVKTLVISRKRMHRVAIFGKVQRASAPDEWPPTMARPFESNAPKFKTSKLCGLKSRKSRVLGGKQDAIRSSLFVDDQ